MDTTLDAPESQPRLDAARELLEERGLFESNRQVSSNELTRELNRRGWRWEVVNGTASATKAYVPRGTVPQTLTVNGPDQLTALTVVLADAVQYDEEHGPSTIRPYRADLVVEADDDRLIALVEVKNLAPLTREEAKDIRRNLDCPREDG